VVDQTRPNRVRTAVEAGPHPLSAALMTASDRAGHAPAEARQNPPKLLVDGALFGVSPPGKLV
jgi:hypothetical protein